MISLLKRIAQAFPNRVHIHRTNTDAKGKGMDVQETSANSAISHNSQANMDAIFSDPKKVAAYLGPSRLMFYDNIINLLHTKGLTCDKKDIADVGCGTGHLLLKISDYFSPLSITGFDFSASVLNIARNTVPAAKFYNLDLYERTNLQFDVVFCTEVIEHLLYPDKALSNLLSMLRNSGTLILTVPNGRLDTYIGHINFWSPESWDVFVKGLCDGFDLDIGRLTVEGTAWNVNYAIIRKN